MEQKPPEIDNRHKEEKVVPPRDQVNEMRQAQLEEQHQRADRRDQDKQ